MKKVLLTFLKYNVHIIMVILFIMYFLPKVNFYFYAERVLEQTNLQPIAKAMMVKEAKIHIVQEEIVDNGFSIELNNANIYLNDIYILNLGQLKIEPWLFYNNISIHSVRLNKSFEDEFPTRLDELHITQSIFSPLLIEVTGIFAYGSFDAQVDLGERKVHANLQVNKKFVKKYRKLLRQLKRVKGGYTYEYSF